MLHALTLVETAHRDGSFPCFQCDRPPRRAWGPPVVCAACQREGVVNAPETELASAEQLTMFLPSPELRLLI